MNVVNGVIFLLFLTCGVQSERILAIFHFPCKSHHILGSTLLKALVGRGHQITMVSPFPFTTQMENYTDIDITGMLEYKEKNIVPKFVTAHDLSMYDQMTFSIKNVKEVAEYFLDHPNVQKLLSSKDHYDLVILNWSMNDALLAIAHHFNAPSIVFSTIGLSHLTNKITKNPAPYSYIPNLFSTYSDEMSFLQRLTNAFWSFTFEMIDYYVNEDVQRQILKKYFPTAPTLKELQDNVSLVLLNSHYGIEGARPFVPNMIEVGGFHIEQVKELRQELKTFLDEAVEGVVLFSLGTNVKSSHLPREKLVAIVKAFARLKVKILWKFEESFDNLPGNVKIDKWLPQTDVLAHPNVKVFVTHGGRLSTIEAIHYGVPIIGIPFFSDQEHNIADSVNKGCGIKVDFGILSEDTLANAINEILTNPSYSENAKQRSRILRDQLIHPLDSAVYWVEYVLSHGGAPHLQTAALKLNWLQYMLIDVVVFVAAIVIVSTTTIYLIIRRIYSRIKLKRTNKTKKS